MNITSLFLTCTGHHKLEQPGQVLPRLVVGALEHGGAVFGGEAGREDHL